MGLFDRLFGDDPASTRTTPAAPRSARSEDEIAVERYRYLLRTAPPETIEQVHAEAFAKLTDSQRALVFRELSENAPAGEAPRADDPASLAQAATRAELRQPGTLERSLQGPSFLSMVGSSMLGTIAGYVIGSALVSAFLPPAGFESADGGSDSTTDAGADDGSSGADTVDAAGADFGADAGGFGDFGGDFGF